MSGANKNPLAKLQNETADEFAARALTAMANQAGELKKDGKLKSMSEDTKSVVVRGFPIERLMEVTPEQWRKAQEESFNKGIDSLKRREERKKKADQASPEADLT